VGPRSDAAHRAVRRPAWTSCALWNLLPRWIWIGSHSQRPAGTGRMIFSLVVPPVGASAGARFACVDLGTARPAPSNLQVRIYLSIG
jgi:hypothetical protein